MYIPESAKERLAPYIKLDTDECIEYPVVDKEGYATFQTYKDGKKIHVRMNRVAYQEYYKDNLTSEWIICHTCDNPKCVNPKHLFKGTNKDNSDDKVRKGRQAKGKTHGNYIHGQYTKEAKAYRHEHPKPHIWQRTISEENIKKIEELRKLGTTYAEIACILGIKYQAIRDMNRGRTHKPISNYIK